MGDSLDAALVSVGTGLIFVSLISLFRKDVRAGFADILKQSHQNNFRSGD
jgi:transporter family-2 protein